MDSEVTVQKHSIQTLPYVEHVTFQKLVIGFSKITYHKNNNIGYLPNSFS